GAAVEPGCTASLRGPVQISTRLPDWNARRKASEDDRGSLHHRLRAARLVEPASRLAYLWRALHPLLRVPSLCARTQAPVGAGGGVLRRIVSLVLAVSLRSLSADPLALDRGGDGGGIPFGVAHALAGARSSGLDSAHSRHLGR